MGFVEWMDDYSPSARLLDWVALEIDNDCLGVFVHIMLFHLALFASIILYPFVFWKEP